MTKQTLTSTILDGHTGAAAIGLEDVLKLLANEGPRLTLAALASGRRDAAGVARLTGLTAEQTRQALVELRQAGLVVTGRAVDQGEIVEPSGAVVASVTPNLVKFAIATQGDDRVQLELPRLDR